MAARLNHGFSEILGQHNAIEPRTKLNHGFFGFFEILGWHNAKEHGLDELAKWVFPNGRS